MIGQYEVQERPTTNGLGAAVAPASYRGASAPRRLPWAPPPLIRASFGLHVAAVAGVAALPEAWPWAGAAMLANHALLGSLGMWPQCPWLGPNLVRLPASAASARQVALTFDDGPDPGVTPAVLDLLDQYAVRASFFFIAQRAAAHPSLVREVVRRGHDVQNHSDRHTPGFACLPPRILAREIGAAQARLADITGVAPRFFRPPMGLRSPLLDPVLARFGLRHVSWTRRGYDTISRDADTVLRRLTGPLAAGDILLLHDAGSARGNGETPVVLAVLPRMLAALAARRLTLVSLTSADWGGDRMSRQLW
ncbi:MAG: polysaccharide deacetylase family protein [Acetobacteraceae bacterium]